MAAITTILSVATILLLVLNTVLLWKVFGLLRRRPKAHSETAAIQGMGEDIENADKEDAEDTADIQQQGLDSDDLPEMGDLIFFQKLEHLMSSEKLYTNPDVSRDSVAMAIGTNRTYLIRSIKFATGKTFYEYINSLRTNYAATLLTTTRDRVDDIGTVSGFRSNSTFYRTFAAAYGCTPVEYRSKNTKR